jgi:hypothetical protein
MGTMHHHAIVVTTGHGPIEEAHAEAERLGLIVSPVTDPAVNAHRSFCVFPDGSKEGWEESDSGDRARAAFVRWLRSKRYEDGSSPFSWVAVSFGEFGLSFDGSSVMR